MTAGLWLALAVLGQIASLRLIDAGPLIHYQHYVLPPAALHDPARAWAVIVVAVQAAIVATGLVVRHRSLAVAARNHRLRVAGVLALSLCFAAAVSRDRRFFVFEFAFAALVQLVNAGNIVLFAWALPEKTLAAVGRAADQLLGGEWKAAVKIDRFAWIAAAWVMLVSAALAWFVYEHHPHVADEVVYLYNARYFAAGKLFMAPPPLPAAFEVDLMDYHADKWFSAVPVGWPAVLAIGEKFHAAWLVNPVLAGANVLLIYSLLGALYPRRIARITVLLLCFSPWYLFLAMSYMNHIVTLTCALAAFWGIMQARATGLARWTFAAGLAIGIMSTIRPLDGAVIALFGAAWALGLGGSRLRLISLAALAAGTAVAGGAALPYNRALNGDFGSPLTHYVDKTYGAGSNAYGFGPNRGLGWAIDPYPGHTPFEAAILGELNGYSVNTELLGWSVGSLVLMATFLFLGDHRRPDYLMLTVIAGVVLAYAPFWQNGGPDFGARYWFLILVPCLALSARGLEWLETKVNTRATAAVAALCAMTFIAYIPWRGADKYHNYLRMRADVPELAVQRGFGRSLVLVRGERFPDYMSAAIYNPLELCGKGAQRNAAAAPSGKTADAAASCAPESNAPIYVWDRSADVRAKIMSLYPDRPVWVLEGPTITGGGYRVAEGPLRAGTTP